nr:hypothetical protein [Tanacetum cinerariifolium]
NMPNENVPAPAPTRSDDQILLFAAWHERQIVAAKEGGKKKTTPKADKPVKPTPAKQAKPATVKQPKPKPVKENPTNPTPIQKADKGKVSLKSFQAQGQAHVGSVTIREPEEEATRPLPVVEGKEKAIATEEQATQSLLALHTPKRRSTTNQYIFQRRTPITEEASIRPSAQPQDDTSVNVVCETPSPIDAETGADTDKVISEGDTEILNIGEEQGEDVDNQGYLEEQTVILDEGQARSDPGKTLESRPPPDDDKMDEDQAGSDPGKTHVALAGPNHEPMHDDFVAIIYPKMHESLKFLADEHIILEDPPRSSRTLSSMKNMDDTYTFGDQFFNDKSTEDETGKQNVDAEFVYMVTVPIHQASTSVPPISTPIIDLSPLKSAASHLPEPFTAATTETTTTTLLLPPPPQQQSTTNSEDRFRELPEANMKEILHQRMFESGSYKSLPDHVALYEALEASMKRANREVFIVVKDKSRKRRHDDQDPPPPPPDSDLNKKKRHDSDASGSKQPPAPQSAAWKMSDTREALSSSSKQQPAPHSEQPVEYVPIPDDENKLLSKIGDIGSFIKWFYKRIGKKKLSKSDLEGLAFKVVKAFHENSISLQFQIEECHRLLTNQVDLVNPEGHRLVPDVSKWSTRSDFRLKKLVPSLWIESERDYNISAANGITHWWFKRKDFYITKHNAPSDRHAVKSRMRILSVISIKTFERYKYTFLKEIVIRRADYNEYKISKADIKKLHPNDFEDLYPPHLQDFLFKEDYTIISKSRVVIYKDRNDQKKMLRENEVHKFSDGTLTRVLHKLDHMVKDFRLYQYNLAWSMESSLRMIKRGVKSLWKSKSENKEIVPTEMKLVLEQTQQGTGHEVSNIRVLLKYHSEDGNSARANIKQALGRLWRHWIRSFRDLYGGKSIHFAPNMRITLGGIKSIANLFTRLNVKLMINFNFCPTSMYKSDLGDCHYACQYCNATYISGIEAAWGLNKTENKFEKGDQKVVSRNEAT